VRVPGFGKPSAEEMEAARRADALGDLALDTLSKTFKLYLRIAPDGRELDPAEAEEARLQVEACARTGRALDADRELVALLAGEFDLGPSLAMIRVMQHSLLLALSDDPARRALAMPVPQVQERMAPVYSHWQQMEERRRR
jgi:hypothetical protein